jgi:ribosomal protein S18 acetylase RimI-like enzyme
MDPQIRSLIRTDTEGLLAFYRSLSEKTREFFAPFSPVTEEVLRDHLEQAETGGHISQGIVDDAGAILGHGFVLIKGRDKPVFGIGLRESLHGRGWGRKLTRSVLDRADELRISPVTLTVIKENTKAKALYEKTGFELRGNATHRRKDDSYYMERTLDA